LVSSVAATSNSGAVSDNDKSKDMDDASDSVEVSGSPTDTTDDRHPPSDPMTHTASDSEDDIEADDDSSAVTQDAGTNNLVQQRVSGTHRAHQLRYDIRLHVSPSEEADKAMISAAKTFLTKAKEMDQSLVVYPWFKNSILPNLKSVASIPETMGAFKQYFHQAQPKVAGDFLYMRLWLGHDKDPKLLDDDLRWWLKVKNFGM
jgi:hypothetical protein